jgi:hypothetical protein
MADADKALGEHMQQKATDKLHRVEGHGLLAVGVTVIPPEEADLPLLHVPETMIGDGNPMGVTAQVVEDFFGTTARLLGIHHPLGSTTLLE